jgi:hypothetical protein
MGMKYCISKRLRDVVSHVVSLDTVYNVMPEGDIKSTIHRIIRQKPSMAALQNIYDGLKAKVKSMPTELRTLFRVLILDMIQVRLGKRELYDIDKTQWMESFEKFQSLPKEDWKAINEARKTQRDTLTKGTPGSQISPHSQVFTGSLINP